MYVTGLRRARPRTTRWTRKGVRQPVLRSHWRKRLLPD